MDKILHAVVSLVLCLAIGAYNLPIGILFTMLMGIGKEVWDKESGKGTPDIYDIVADFIGILVASAMIMVSNNL